MDIIQKIEQKLYEPLLHKGYGVVRVQVSGNVRRVLQVMIERVDGQPITLDDCADVSPLISIHMDVENILRGPYVLEVSSPGLDRPLVKIEDYKRFTGYQIDLNLFNPLNNRKKWQGHIESASDSEVILIVDEEETGEKSRITIPYAAIRSARLHISL